MSSTKGAGKKKKKKKRKRKTCETPIQTVTYSKLEGE